MNGNPDAANLEFRYRRLSPKDKAELLDRLAKMLDSADEIIFAYVHGSFVERDSFRDLDVAIWIKDRDKSFYYTIDFSARIGVEVGNPVDVQVLNEASLPFKYYVFTRGRLLLSKDEAVRLKTVDESIRQYLDLRNLAEIVSKESAQ